MLAVRLAHLSQVAQMSDLRWVPHRNPMNPSLIQMKTYISRPRDPRSLRNSASRSHHHIACQSQGTLHSPRHFPFRGSMRATCLRSPIASHRAELVVPHRIVRFLHTPGPGFPGFKINSRSSFPNHRLPPERQYGIHQFTRGQSTSPPTETGAAELLVRAIPGR